MKRYTIIGSGQYNWDIIKLLKYPDGFNIGKRNPFVEETLIEEVGGTCGNVMCMLGKGCFMHPVLWLKRMVII